MNCQPGDLARIVTPGPATGALCLILEAYKQPGYWKIELLSVARIWNQQGGHLIRALPGRRDCICRDSDLRPIPPKELANYDLTATSKEAERAAP